MSRLMRDELERQNRGSLVERALSRWWVLVPVLLLVVGIIAWTFWPLSQDALFDRGTELMKSKELSDWERAWRDYFQPLNERFPDHPYQEQVEKYRMQIEQARNALLVPELGMSEGQRLFEQGQQLVKEGKTREALELWERLMVVFKDVE